MRTHFKIHFYLFFEQKGTFIYPFPVFSPPSLGWAPGSQEREPAAGSGFLGTGTRMSDLRSGFLGTEPETDTPSPDHRL